MSTISFERNLVIETPEELERLIYAIEQGERMDPIIPRDFSEEEARGRAFVERGYKAFIMEQERRKNERLNNGNDIL